MFAILALVLYNVQWLGIVLGVGAEVVLMAAHLSNLHHHKPQWLEHVPAVRIAQGTGLVLIILSGLGAVGYHVALGATAALAIPTFGFKWVLIATVSVSFLLERHLARGRAVLEGFAGGSWYALFMVHSVAPVLAWLDLSALYIVWLLFFGAIWALAIGAMKLSATAAPAVAAAPISAPAPAAIKVATVALKPIQQTPAPKPIAPVPQPPKPAAIVPPPAPQPKPEPPHPVVKPVAVAKPVAPAAPVMTPDAVVTPAPQNMSLWRWLLARFARKTPKAAPVVVASAPAPAPKPVEAPKPAQPIAPMAAASAPIPTLATTNSKPQAPAAPTPMQPAPVQPAATVKPGLPAIEPLELAAPHIVPAAPAAPVEKPYVPDWSHLPGLRVMPQRAEDLHLHNRAPVVQLA